VFAVWPPRRQLWYVQREQIEISLICIDNTTHSSLLQLGSGGDRAEEEVRGGRWSIVLVLLGGVVVSGFCGSCLMCDPRMPDGWLHSHAAALKRREFLGVSPLFATRRFTIGPLKGRYHQALFR
jgi:hypothetical protein